MSMVLPSVFQVISPFFLRLPAFFYQDCSSLAWCLFKSLLKELLSVLVMIFLSIFRVTGSANS